MPKCHCSAAHRPAEGHKIISHRYFFGIFLITTGCSKRHVPAIDYLTFCCHIGSDSIVIADYIVPVSPEVLHRIAFCFGATVECDDTDGFIYLSREVDMVAPVFPLPARQWSEFEDIIRFGLRKCRQFQKAVN